MHLLKRAPKRVLSCCSRPRPSGVETFRAGPARTRDYEFKVFLLCVRAREYEFNFTYPVFKSIFESPGVALWTEAGRVT